MEGPFFNGQMTPFLNVLGQLPLDQPYNNPPFNYNGGESVVAIPNSNIVDWVLVDIVKYTPSESAALLEIIDRSAGFVLKGGEVVGLDGASQSRDDSCIKG